jgi:GMP synthase (glutamine-hydrolysing)
MVPTEPKVWAFVHVTHEDLGSFEHVLRAHGIRPRTFLTGTCDIERLDPAEPDLVIIMGGPMGVYEANTYPHLHHEIRFAEARMALGKPILGICLGSQIMAKALGARVYKGATKEVGWNPGSVNEDGMQTPLRHLDQSQCVCAHWHGDTFDLPKGAKLLASSAMYPHQAFSYGKNALALQFHPEVTEVKLERWYARLVCDIHEAGHTVESMREMAHRHGDRLKNQNRCFFTDWLDEVAPGLLVKHQHALVDAG